MEEKLRTLKLSGHVGFDSLPDQLVSKSVQNGFTFNIMCIGKKNKFLIVNIQNVEPKLHFLYWRFFISIKRLSIIYIDVNLICQVYIYVKLIFTSIMCLSCFNYANYLLID